MASPYKLFKTDPEIELAGVVINYGDEAWFRIARAGGANKRYMNQMSERLKPFRRQLQTETMDEKVADRIVLEVFVDTILMGWGSRVQDPNDPTKTVDADYIEDENGNHLQFNRENALRVLTELPELFQALRAESDRMANFTLAVKEEDAKN